MTCFIHMACQVRNTLHSYSSRVHCLSLMLMLSASALVTPAAFGQDEESSLFENVVKALETGYFDKDFRRDKLPAIVERYRRRAYNAKTLQEQREVTHDLLSNLPASHMGLLSRTSKERLIGELQNELRSTFGFELVEYDGKHYAHGVLEAGPAELAGLKPGDRIIFIDGRLVSDSPRLDWRTDDAYLPDPPMRALLCEPGDTLHLVVEQSWGELREIEIEARDYSMYEAAKASARIIEHDGKRIGYIHFWVIHISGVASLLKEKLGGQFADCDAFVLDLRGRGGSGGAIPGLLRALQGEDTNWSRPVVALINRHSRSAKEVIAYELRRQNIALLVGETTAGAVIPASFDEVGHETILMYPKFTLGGHTDHLEGIGVAPDVAVEDIRPYSAGNDPVLNVGLREAARLAGQYVPPDPTLAVAPEVAISLEPLAPSDILSRMVKALGGEKAIRKHTSRTLTGTLDFSGMMEGSLTITAAAPNLFLSKVTLPGMGAFKNGYDGSVAWRDDPQQGQGIMEGDELEEMLIQADFYESLNYEQRYENIESADAEYFDGRQCYVLKLHDTAGKVRTMYIDAATFLEAGSQSMQNSHMGGSMQVVITNIAYTEFDGIMFPTQIRQKMGDVQEMTITISDVSFAPVEKHVFELPESIRSLVNTD